MTVKSYFKATLLLAFIFAFLPTRALAESASDTISANTASSTDTISSVDYKFAWRRTILPASLIGVGAVAVAPTFIRNGSRHITNDIIDIRGNGRRLTFDNYVQYVPAAGALVLGCVGVKARHTLGERALIIATAYATAGILTKVPKMCVDERRPQFASNNSFPSGHTAKAFMGAELVRIEYGGWYGVGAYALATGVGFLRMYNGRHWLHDVLAGAGIGILSARVGEWSCGLWRRVIPRKSKGGSAFVVTPVAFPSAGGCYGVAMSCVF